MDKDRIKGSAKQTKGAVKEVIGKVTGDAKLEAEGKSDKVARKGSERGRRPQGRASRQNRRREQTDSEGYRRELRAPLRHVGLQRGIDVSEPALVWPFRRTVHYCRTGSSTGSPQVAPHNSVSGHHCPCVPGQPSPLVTRGRPLPSMPQP